jgi:hypothetical protein
MGAAAQSLVLLAAVSRADRRPYVVNVIYDAYQPTYSSNTVDDAVAKSDKEFGSDTKDTG